MGQFLGKWISKAIQECEDVVEVLRDDKLVPHLLYDLLVCPSPSGLEEFIIKKLPFRKDGKIDAFGNFYIKVGDNPTTMFSCHTDTRHSTVPDKFIKEKKECRIRLLTKDPDKSKPNEWGYVWGAVFNKDKGKFFGTQLGADDKVGCYILSELIDHEVPGLYVFHAAEEVGCLGSKYILEKTPELLKGIQRCIAFDRRAYGDVIAHQLGSRCASSKFTNAIAVALNAGITTPMNKFKGDVHGMCTDSATYMNAIPECTNISVGYFNEHTYDEHQDMYWLTSQLLPSILQVKWDELPVERDPVARTVTRVTYHDSSSGRVWNDAYFSTKSEAKHVTEWTPEERVPDWEPKGFVYPLEVPPKAMQIIIKKYIKKTEEIQVAEVITKLLIERDYYKTKLEEFQPKEEQPETKEEAKLPLNDDVSDIETDTSFNALVSALQQGPAEKFVLDKNIGSDGIPEDKEEYLKRANEKLGIISTIYSNRLGIGKLKGLKLDSFQHQFLKYNKLMEKVRSNKGKVDKKQYIILNTIISNLSITLGGLPINNSKVTKALENANAYIESHWYEPGIIIKRA